MAVLYPPYIEGKIPAQTGDTLRIPFQLNRALGPADLEGGKVYARIKTATTNMVVDELVCDFNRFSEKDGFYWANYIITSDGKYEVGENYKIQLSFDKGYYSTVGVFKYTAEPVVALNYADEVSISRLIGSYANSNDPLEKVYKYRFNIYKNLELIETTGWLTHNTSLDSESTSSIDIYDIKTDVIGIENMMYIYEVETINGLKSSASYQSTSATVEFDCPLSGTVINIPDDGLILISLEKRKEAQGCYLLERYDGSNYWTFKKLRINTEKMGSIEFKDFVIEHGITYTYYIRQVDEKTGISTGRVRIGEATAYFEDMFLWDGERQLNVKYNPQVTSFKDTILEQKLNTLGGRFPFFFRNGNTRYKEFPISGLISENIDENEYFIHGSSVSEQCRTNTPSKGDSLEEKDKFYTERLFKLEVMDWLNNGKLKLFKSPAEGNYIVRIMNVSLAPNAQLGRRLHTFSATAYEAAEYNYSNLMDKGWISGMHESQLNLNFGSYNFDSDKFIKNEYGYKSMKLFSNDGAIFKLHFKYSSPVEIKIGYTGVYIVEIDNNNSLIGVDLVSGSGIAEYTYSDLPLLNASEQAYTVAEIRTVVECLKGYCEWVKKDINVLSFKIMDPDFTSKKVYTLNENSFTLFSNYIELPPRYYEEIFLMLETDNLVAEICYSYKHIE